MFNPSPSLPRPHHRHARSLLSGRARTLALTAARAAQSAVIPAGKQESRRHGWQIIRLLDALKPAAAIALTALLTACGFHLRGDLHLDGMRIHISGGEREMATALTDALSQHGATVTATVDATDTRIELRAGEFHRATLTTDARGRTSAFEIRYTVKFTIHRPGDGGGDGDDDGDVGDGENESHTVTLTRAFDYDRSRQLQSESESNFLQHTMRIEAAARIMQYLTRD